MIRWAMTNRIPMYAKLKRYIYGLIAENYEKKQFKLPSENILWHDLRREQNNRKKGA